MTRRTTGVSTPGLARVGPVSCRDGPTDLVGEPADRSRQERVGVWLRVGVEESNRERSTRLVEVSGRVGTESDRERSARLQLVFDCRVGEGAVDRVLVFPPLNDLVSRQSGWAVVRVGLDVG